MINFAPTGDCTVMPRRTTARLSHRVAFSLAIPWALSVTLSTPPAQADAPRHHDGFFLRVGVGAGGLSAEREGRISLGTSSFYAGTSNIAGGGGAFELSMGGALRPGLVLAGTFASQQVGKPVLEQDGRERKLEGPFTFALLGIALDWYPEPGGGFHVGGAASIAGAWVKSPQPAFTEYLGGGGGALSAHLGYSFWVSPQWSLGALLRVAGARLHGEETQFGITGSEDDDVRSVSVLVGATFN